MGTMFEPTFEAFPVMGSYGNNSFTSSGPSLDFEAGSGRSGHWQDEKICYNESCLNRDTPELSSRPSSRTSSRPSSFMSSSWGSLVSSIGSNPDSEPYKSGLDPRIVDYEIPWLDSEWSSYSIPDHSSLSTDYSSVDQSSLHAHDDFFAPELSGASPAQFSFSLKAFEDAKLQLQVPLIPVSFGQHFSYENPPYPTGVTQPSSSNRSELGSDDSIHTIGRYQQSPSIFPKPDLGKGFKDLKAHLLSHSERRVEKCPIVTCEYHIKGFCRKYDKHRHTLTHFKGTLVCNFCPSKVITAVKTFQRADVFKRHLVSVHGAENTLPPTGRKRSGSRHISARIESSAYHWVNNYAHCSNCAVVFANPQSLLNHLDDCVMSSILRQGPNSDVHQPQNGEAHRCSSNTNCLEESWVFDTRHCVINKGDDLARKRSDDYPPLWECPEDPVNMKKRAMTAFDGNRHLWKDETIFATDFDINMPWNYEVPHSTRFDMHKMANSELYYSAEWSTADSRALPYLDAPKDYPIWVPNISRIQRYSSSAPATSTGTTKPRGVQMRSPRTVLTDHDRIKICNFHEQNPTVKEKEIGVMFNVQTSTVSKILRNKRKYLFTHHASMSTETKFVSSLSAEQTHAVESVGRVLKCTNDSESANWEDFPSASRKSHRTIRSKPESSGDNKAHNSHATAGKGSLRRKKSLQPAVENGDKNATHKEEASQPDLQKDFDQILSSCPDAKASIAETPEHVCESFAPSPETEISEDISDDESVSDCSTDWGEAQNSNTPGSDIYGVLANSSDSQVEGEKNLLRPVLCPMKQALVDRIMAEFWTIVNQEWATNLTKCAGETPASSSPSGSSGGLIGGSSPRMANRKRQRDDEEPPPDDNNGRTPKRPNSQSDRSPAKNGVKFACPYRKHAPQRYTIYKHRSCALSHWDTVARVKEHLYRRHRVPIQCKRCWQSFKVQEALDAHLTVVNICALRTGQATEGLTADLEKRLKSRKKSSPDQTEEARWKDIYGLLFPNEVVPNPYFEPVQENAPQSPDSRELADYEEYSRQELPRFVRSYLEDAVNNETQHLEEHIRSQLVSIVQDCQARIFSAYKSRAANKESRPTPPSATADACVTPPASQASAEDAAHAEKPEAKNIVASVYQAPPPTPQSTLQYVPDLRDIRGSGIPSKMPEHISFSDSAYSSNGTGGSQIVSTQSQAQDGTPSKPSADLYTQFTLADDGASLDVNQDLILDESYDIRFDVDDPEFNELWAI